MSISLHLRIDNLIEMKRHSHYLRWKTTGAARGEGGDGGFPAPGGTPGASRGEGSDGGPPSPGGHPGAN